MKYPDIIIHADWSTNPRNRWYCRADYCDPDYIITGPFQISRVNEFLDTIRDLGVNNTRILLGFDFVMGIPKDYAERASISNFKSWLRLLGEKEWADIFKIANNPSEISIYRPFYPHNPTKPGVKQQHLINGLNLSSRDQLNRQCELRNKNRDNACPLFWTLGAKQVGRGSLLGWQEVLLPMINDPNTWLWPFDGTLHELVDRGGIVITETYPAEYYRPLDINFDGGKSKTNQEDRKGMASAILAWPHHLGAMFSGEMEKEIKAGFGSDKDGDDKFDSLVGLLGILAVFAGIIKDNVPVDKERLNIEGWIIGA